MDTLEKKIFNWQEAHGHPIRVGMAGVGAFGCGILSKLHEMKATDVPVLHDTTVDRGIQAFIDIGYNREDIVAATSREALYRGIEAGKRVVVEDGLLIADSPVDVVVDSTGYPAFGARFAFESIHNGKHVVMVNLEADAVVGSTLGLLAEKTGVVYTVADGDQPSHIKGLVDWARALEFDVVAAGKGAHLYPGFKGKMWNSMTDSFMDGSKNQEELACAANMIGLVPDIEGMHAPSLTVEQIPCVLCPREDGGILTRSGVIETVNCLSDDMSEVSEEYYQERAYEDYETVLKMRKMINPYMCTFIVIRASSPYVAKYMQAKGGMFMDQTNRYGLVYRPHQIGGIETPTSVLRAALYHEATGVQLPKPVVDVIAVAKKDIKAGERLDGIGGSTIRALMVEAGQSLSCGYLPYGLANDVTAGQDIPMGTKITYGMLQKRGDSFIWQLRGLQDIRNMPSGVK